MTIPSREAGKRHTFVDSGRAARGARRRALLQAGSGDALDDLTLREQEHEDEGLMSAGRAAFG